MLVTSIFSFSNNVFYSSNHKVQFLSHDYFVVCKCFEFGLIKALTLSFGKELIVYSRQGSLVCSESCNLGIIGFYVIEANFSCSVIVRSGAYYFTVVFPCVCPSVCLHKLLYHTILTLNNPKNEAFENVFGKQAFSPFPIMFSILPQTNLTFSYIQWIPLYRNPDNGDFRLFATFCLAPILFPFRQCKIHRIIGTLIKDIFGLLQQKSSHRLEFFLFISNFGT